MAGSTSSDLYHIVDDFYYSALHDQEEIFPISDEKYAEALQLQEALISSSASLTPSAFQNVSSIPSTTPHASSSLSSKQPLVTSEAGQLPQSFCDICMDTKAASEMFRNTNVCGHLFCLDCTRRHVAAKIKENITMVECPDPKCKGVIGPELCQSIVPKEVLERWEKALCESLILGSGKFDCPFKDCSATTSHASSSLSSKQPLVTSEAGQLPESFCDICMDTKTASEMFRNTNVCGHLFCLDCIRRHVAAKIKENITIVECPDPKCKAVIGPELCQSIVPKEVLGRWEKTLCESLILGSEKFYCPFKDCSATTPHASSSLSSKQPLVTSEAGHLPESFCDICMDTKTASEIFRNTNVCGHLFCLDCIRRHVAAKIKENITMVECPDPKCKGVIGPELCQSIVPKEVLERWEKALCESLILGSEKFYCPFKDCSAMLVDDGIEAVTSSECPNCNRLFCAQCKVAWHSGIDCREFQSLEKGEIDPEDIMLMELAKNKKWRRCPCCKFFVEKLEGCLHISCRCGYQFCYGCGKEHHGSHVCGSA